MKGFTSFLCLLILILGSCSTDDLSDEFIVPDFTVIGEENGTYYQFTFNAATKESSLIDLTGELGMSINSLRSITYTDNIVSFYDRKINTIRAWQKNLNTGEIRIYDSFFEIEEDQYLIWATHSSDYIYVGYEAPLYSGDVYIKVIDRILRTARDFYLTTVSRASLIGRPMHYNDKLLITFSNLGVYQTIVYDTKLFNISDTIFYSGVPHILKNSNGSLSIFDNGNQYYQYDLTSSTRQQEIMLGTIPSFMRFGNLPDPIVHNGKIYHKSPAAQPSSLSFYPGIFDINRQENTIIDVNRDVQISFEPLEGIRFIPLTITYDINTEVYLVGFTANYAEGTKGIMVFDKNRKLVNAIEVPFSPLQIILP